MKKGIHPTYYPAAAVSCACGNQFAVGSTKEKIEVEICAACHPFFSGTEKIIDTAGRVEKFKRRRAAASLAAPAKKAAGRSRRSVKPTASFETLKV